MSAFLLQMQRNDDNDYYHPALSLLAAPAMFANEYENTLSQTPYNDDNDCRCPAFSPPAMLTIRANGHDK